MNNEYQEHRASELYSPDDNGFICPHCSEELYLQIRYEREHILVGQCQECQGSLCIKLPEIRKKLIYLDQWFVSNLLDKGKAEQFKKLIKKIEKLIAQQKVMIIVSDVHVSETASIPLAEKQKSIWEKFNSLANGRISRDSQDIMISQTKRLLEGESEEVFPSRDILDSTPHNWIVGQYIGSGVHAQVQLTNSGRLKLEKKFTPSTEEKNQQLMGILQRQCSEVDHDSSENECFNYIKKLWLLEIEDAAAYSRRLSKVLSGDSVEEGFVPSTKGMDYYPIIKDLVEKCSATKKMTMEGILDFFDKSTTLPKYMSISIALEAQRLFSALQALKKEGKITNNSKKFSRKYGVSSLNDAAHISSYLPYVDILITDDKAREVLLRSPVVEQLSDIRCKVYSNSNIDLFEEYLNELEEETQSKDVSLTLHLIHSVSWNQQTLLLKKALIEKLSRKTKSRD